MRGHDRGILRDVPQQQPTRLIAVVFIDYNYAPNQDAQIHMYIIGNYFGIILKVTGQYRGRVINNHYFSII